MSDAELDAALRSYWEAGGGDLEQAQDIATRALADPPREPMVMARAVQVVERLSVPPNLSERINRELFEPLRETRTLMALVDRAGDEQVDLEVVLFEDLSELVPQTELDGVDVAALANQRLDGDNRAARARRVFDALPWDRLPDPPRARLRELVEMLDARARQFPSHFLVRSDAGDGLVIGLRVSRDNRGTLHYSNSVDEAMKTQARVVLDPFVEDGAGVAWGIEWELSYGGRSIGLALKLAALVRFAGLPPDPLLAATGAVQEDGSVTAVAGVYAKLHAAEQAGFRRVLLPEANKSDVDTDDHDLQLIFVDHVDQVATRLREITVSAEFSWPGRGRLGRASLGRYGLELDSEKRNANAIQLHVNDGRTKAILNIWSGAKGKVTADGPSGSAHDLVQQLIDEVFNASPAVKRPQGKWLVAQEARRERLQQLLEQAGADAREAKGTGEVWRYSLRRGPSTATLTLWRTGSCVLVGEAPAWDELRRLVETALEGLASAKEPSQTLDGASRTIEAIIAQRPAGPWIGTDESGKGDYFGPLVSAAVYADHDIARRLEEAGVRDSKKLSDKRVIALAQIVREATGGRYKVTSINPERYNELYEEMRSEGKNLNSLLAWGHTFSIKDLIDRGMTPKYAIVDQFADASYIRERLGKEVGDAGVEEIIQVPKAEADVAVAAASILAREAFLDWLERTSRRLGLVLPKGASPKVIEVAQAIVARDGEAALAGVAKLQFKTTKQVLEK